MKRVSVPGTWLGLILVFLAAWSPAAAQEGDAAHDEGQDSPKKAEDQESEKEKKGPYKDFEELTENAVVREGLLRDIF